jgi:hypothetical protein
LERKWNMEMFDEIRKLTQKLLSYNHLFLKYFEEARETGTSPAFNEVIKPFANEVNSIAVQWGALMKDWLKISPQKHLHPKQIDTTLDHIEQLSIQAFFPKTSRSRFINANRTVEYFLMEIMKELDK